MYTAKKLSELTQLRWRHVAHNTLRWRKVAQPDEHVKSDDDSQPGELEVADAEIQDIYQKAESGLPQQYSFERLPMTEISPTIWCLRLQA